MRRLRFGKIIIFFFILVLIPALSFASNSQAQKHLDKGNELYQNGKYLEAANEFNAAANLEPDNFLVWENLGWAYWRLGKQDVALGIWDNLLKLQPDDTSVMNRIASIYGNVFEYDKAISLLEKSISLKPGQKEAQIGLGKVYLKMADFEKALDKIKNLKKIYPQDEEILNLEATVLDRFSKYDAALKAWSELVRLKPQVWEYKLNVAFDHFWLGHYNEAVKLAKEILKEKPDYVDALKLLAEEAAIRKDFNQAKTLFFEALKYKPEDIDTLNRLSELAMLNKDYDTVIKAATLSLKKNPDQYIEYMNRADAYLVKKEYASALKDYHFILSNNPHEINTLIGIFWVYSNQGADRKAIETLKLIEKVLPKSDPQSDILITLMNMYSDNGLEAIKVLRNFQDSLRQGTVTTLLYHGLSVNPDDPENVFVNDFREQIKMLKQEGYNSITLTELADYCQNNKPLPAKPLLITFDDARQDSYLYGEPILKEFGFKATMFVPLVRVRTRPDVTLGFNELRKMLASGRWDIQAHGDYAHDLVIVDAAGRKEDFLTNKRWLFAEDRLESDAEFSARISKDYKESREILEREIPGAKIIAYAFPRGNFGQISFTNYPASLEMNLKLLKEFYKFGLYQNKYGQTILGKDNLFIQRYGLSPGTKAQELQRYLRENELNYLALQYMAEAYISLGKFAKAEEILRQIPNKDNERAKKNLADLSIALKPTFSPQYLHFSDNKQRIKNKYSLHFYQYLSEGINFHSAYERAFFNDKGYGRINENQVYTELSYYPSLKKGISLASKTRMFSSDKDVLGYRIFGETAVTDRIFTALSFERDSVDTARGILAGIRYYRSKLYIDIQPTKLLSASFRYEHDSYSDDNRKDYTSLLLMQRLRRETPEFFAGYAYRWGNSKFNAAEYYSPQDLSINEAHFKAVIAKGKLDFTQYCVIGYGRDTNIEGLAHSFTSTLRYNIKKGLDLFSEFVLDRTPSYRSNKVSAGVEYRF